MIANKAGGDMEKIDAATIEEIRGAISNVVGTINKKAERITGATYSADNAEKLARAMLLLAQAERELCEAEIKRAGLTAIMNVQNKLEDAISEAIASQISA